MIQGPEYEIRTTRLGLRQWREEDLEMLAAMNRDPEVMKHFPSMPTRAESAEFIKRQQKMQHDNGVCFFAADYVLTGEFVGFVGMSVPRFESYFTPCIEMGWRLRKSFWNKGLATEAAQTCLGYARQRKLANELYAFTIPSNLGSRKVMEKIGMTHIGEFLHPKIPDGHPMQELVLYKIIL